ncbi:hypothetical protein J5751_06165 [bacterium]|nr:hypothetical protein [bacterium]
MTPEDRRTFNNLFETDFKSFVEDYLQRLINEIERGTVDTDLSLEQGDKFQAILDCEYVNEDLRNNLSALIYGADERK